MTDWVWTDENVARLRRLVGEHLSGGQIAAIFHVSRNTVMGKVARLGLKFTARPGGRKVGHGLSHARKTPYVYKPRPGKPTDADVERLAIEPEPVGPVGDFPAAGACRWIHGDPKREWRCCGAPGQPWCEHHATRLHIKGSALKSKSTPNWSVPSRRAA